MLDLMQWLKGMKIQDMWQKPQRLDNDKPVQPETVETNDNSLPQSGEESLSWLGILLSNLGLGSMFIKRKKKQLYSSMITKCKIVCGNV